MRKRLTETEFSNRQVYVDYTNRFVRKNISLIIGNVNDVTVVNAQLKRNDPIQNGVDFELMVKKVRFIS